MTNLQQDLLQDHEEHELLLEQLAAALETGRPALELRECWADFEENLFDHMAAEERFLFSVTSQAHRMEIEKLRTEHRQIRQVALGLSAFVELGSLKKEALDELAALLHAHTEHERRSLHLWLEQDEGILAQRGVKAIRSRREHSSPRLRVLSKLTG